MRLSLSALACLCLLMAACGSKQKVGTTGVAKLRPACVGTHYWNGTACSARAAITQQLKRATKALADFDVDTAMPLLVDARTRGPHRHETLIRIYAQLGIAHAYQKHEAKALKVFDLLLALSPGHLLSYHLSPKVTFIYEQARIAAKKRQAPALHVTWPRGLKTTTPVPVDISVVADPKSFLTRAAIHVRRKGDSNFRRVDVALPKVGKYRRVRLPALSSDKPEILQLFVTALDSKGNEVLRWSDAQRPREIALDYRKPARWYRKWWVWAIAGGVVAAGTGTTVYLIGREPPDTIDGGLGITR